MKPWSAFLKDVRPQVPGTPEPILEHALLRAAQTFCTETRAWKVELDPTLTVDGQLDYDINLDRAELVRLEAATLNGNAYTVWRQGSDTVGDRYVFSPDGKTIEFTEQPEAGLPLVLTCSLKPSNDAIGVDDAIYDRYVAVIAAGAVAALKNDAVRFLDFQAQCNRIKTRLWRGEAAIRPRARASFF